VRVKESHEKCVPLIFLEPGHKVTQEFVSLYEHLSDGA
jgi:chromosome partitioning protein